MSCRLARYFSFCFSRRFSSSTKRSGTPWETTSSYISRNCRPILPLMSPPRLGSALSAGSIDVSSGRDAAGLRFFISRPRPPRNTRSQVRGGPVRPPPTPPPPPGSEPGNFFCSAELGTILLVDLIRGGIFRVHVSNRRPACAVPSPLRPRFDRQPKRRRCLCGRHPGSLDRGFLGAQ